MGIDMDAAVVSAEPQVVHDIAALLRSADEFLLAGHVRPDGDCLGSCLGLFGILEQMGKKVRFFTPGPLPDFLDFLPNYDRIETEIPTTWPSTVIYVDSSDPSRVHEDFKPDGAVLINIDHHLSNSHFGRLNWVDTEASAAAEQIYRLALVLGADITPEVATCLFTGILTDSGGFRFSNADEAAFNAAAHLVRCGARPADIAGFVFENRRPESVRLVGEVYRNLHYEFDGRLVWAEIDQALYRSVGGEMFEPEGLSSDLRGIRGVEVSVLFHETSEGCCRIGLRSKSWVNVSEIATQLGGGGHFNASGAYIREPYRQVRDRSLAVIREYLARVFATTPARAG
jgi:phosphoesterase RecJ-like protein